jgi:hypothetical protein
MTIIGAGFEITYGLEPDNWAPIVMIASQPTSQSTWELTVYNAAGDQLDNSTAPPD